jgi:carbon storage regulator CsrA
MLFLSRKPGEKVVIAESIIVTVVAVLGKQVRLRFEAPERVRILRAEIAGWNEQPPSRNGPVDASRKTPPNETS